MIPAREAAVLDFSYWGRRMKNRSFYLLMMSSCPRVRVGRPAAGCIRGHIVRDSDAEKNDYNIGTVVHRPAHGSLQDLVPCTFKTIHYKPDDSADAMTALNDRSMSSGHSFVLQLGGP